MRRHLPAKQKGFPRNFGGRKECFDGLDTFLKRTIPSGCRNADRGRVIDVDEYFRRDFDGTLEPN